MEVVVWKRFSREKFCWPFQKNLVVWKHTKARSMNGCPSEGLNSVETMD